MKDNYRRVPPKIFRLLELSNITVPASFSSNWPAVSVQAPGQSSRDAASSTIEKKHLWESSTPVFY